MSNKQFTVETPDSKTNIEVGEIKNNRFKIIANFLMVSEFEFLNELQKHPYISEVTDIHRYEAIIIVYDNYDAEIFMEDLATLMDVYIYEKSTTI